MGMEEICQTQQTVLSTTSGISQIGHVFSVPLRAAN